MNLVFKKLKQFKPIFFILPALFFYVIFLAKPIISTVQYSFYQWDGASPVMKFVGFDNYNRMIHDQVFWSALGHNIFWIIGTVILPLGVGLVLAILLSNKAVKGKLIFRVSYFLPVIVSLVAVGIIWNWIYHPDFGIINSFFRFIGLDGLAQAWLGNERTVLPALLIAGSWTYYGFCMVIFLAAIQGIDNTYYEAAKIEGANYFQTFFYVTVPLLKSTITLLVLNSLIGSFKVFDLIFLMTKGGPYHSSEVIGTYMFNEAFTMNNIGYGSAISIALALIIAICSITYMRFVERAD
ncbi:raffinose/stachyose/melibiose transport system permease protein [Neobacillus niacini]|uniref:carbohydrate ABC transporter permease n=1 Tax=Neobacillus driksii TaxID=3035913 RepID=UPI0027839E6C|nr:sugar ABC transporter permease [Neobacillus niacini]MDQ0972258.1 raffinose/stachyose/melibiose transport system permease protein [Neobacillus niacini]